MIVTIHSEQELLEAFSGGKLYGYTPAEKLDAKAFQYPVKFETSETDKTFKLYVEPKQETSTTTEPKPSKKKLSKGAIAGIVIGVIAAVAIIVGLAVGLTSCSEPPKNIKCLEYNQHGICTQEELIYQKRG